MRKRSEMKWLLLRKQEVTIKNVYFVAFNCLSISKRRQEFDATSPYQPSSSIMTVIEDFQKKISHLFYSGLEENGGPDYFPAHIPLRVSNFSLLLLQRGGKMLAAAPLS